jgi:hypothetical protein
LFGNGGYLNVVDFGIMITNVMNPVPAKEYVVVGGIQIVSNGSVVDSGVGSLAMTIIPL